MNLGQNKVEDIEDVSNEQLVVQQIEALEASIVLTDLNKQLDTMLEAEANLQDVLATVESHGIDDALVSLIGDEMDEIAPSFRDKDVEGTISSTTEGIKEVGTAIKDFIIKILKGIRDFFKKIGKWIASLFKSEKKADKAVAKKIGEVNKANKGKGVEKVEKPKADPPPPEAVVTSITEAITTPPKPVEPVTPEQVFEKKYPHHQLRLKR